MVKGNYYFPKQEELAHICKCVELELLVDNVHLLFE